jgi:PadR family transcriptional regulator PadR
MDRDRKSSTQAFALLRAMSEKPRTWRHGYDLSRETRLRSGTLYPILMRLTDRGLLDSKWQPSDETGRPPRHLYRLTTQGIAYAQHQLDAASAAQFKAPQISRA